MVGRKFVFAHVYGKAPGAAWDKNFQPPYGSKNQIIALSLYSFKWPVW